MFCCFLSSRLAGDTGFEWSPKPKGVVPTVAFEMNPQDSLRSPDSTLPLRAHSDRFIPFSQGIWLSRDSRKLPESACRRWLSSRNRFQLSRWKAVGDRVRNSWMRKQIQLYLIYNSHLQRTRTISICTPTKDTQKLSQKFNFVKLDLWSNLFMDSSTIITLILDLISNMDKNLSLSFFFFFFFKYF